jgi:hypothetical protein
LSKAAEKAKSHLGPYGKPQNLGGLLLSFCRVSTETLKQKQTGESCFKYGTPSICCPKLVVNSVVMRTDH